MKSSASHRLTAREREELVKRVLDQGDSVTAVARSKLVSEPTVRKWMHRFAEAGLQGLSDRSSRPHQTHEVSASVQREIKSLHEKRHSGREIAAATTLSEATVSRVLRKLGMTRYKNKRLLGRRDSAKSTAAELEDRERRRRIIYHAARLFLRNGYERTSLAEIALRAGVAKSTIYRCFKSKLNLASAVLRSSHSNVILELREVLQNGTSLDDALFRFAVRDIVAMSGRIAGRPFYEFGRFALEISYRHPQVARRWIEEARIGIHTPLAEFLQKQIERGLLENIDASFLAHHFSESLVYGGTLILSAAENKLTLWTEAGIEEVARLKVQLFLNGCRKSMLGALNNVRTS